MRNFIKRTTYFLLTLLILIIIGAFIPPTPYVSESLLFATQKKDSLLANTETPRIIFVGASNIAFGLNSQIIKDSLHLNPINTGLHIGFGLKYMLDNTLSYIKEGDIVVLSFEYEHFFRDLNWTSEELIRTIFEVNRTNPKYMLLNQQQYLSSIKHFIKISLSRFTPKEYFGFNIRPDYSINSFNEYGDVFTHWNKEKGIFPIHDFIDPTSLFNEEVIQKIKNFENDVLKIGGTVYVTYPGFQDKSFIKNECIIKKVEDKYIENRFTILGTPEKYILPDSLMYDSPYHPSKNGADIRTLLFIEDFKKVRM